MKTIVKTTLTAIGLLLALPACAQQAAPTPTPAATDADPALWVVKDEDTTVYLFGTVHVLKPGLSWFDEAVKTAFDRSGELVLELTEEDQAGAAPLFMTKGMNPTGPALSEKVPADKRALVTKALADSGLPAQAYERMDPWLASILMMAQPLQKLGYNPANGVEAVLTAAAKQGNKSVSALETTAQQVGYFDGISEDAQIKMLISSAEESGQLGTFLEEMVGYWAKGDADGLARFINDNLKESAELSRVLLADRNARWAEWVKARMAKPGTVFVAVGAGHLAGADSVQAQLGKLAIKSERVKY